MVIVEILMKPTPNFHQMRRIVGIGAILRPLPSFDESTLTIVASNDGTGEEITHEAIDIHDLTCFATIKLVKILQMAKL